MHRMRERVPSGEGVGEVRSGRGAFGRREGTLGNHVGVFQRDKTESVIKVEGIVVVVVDSGIFEVKSPESPRPSQKITSSAAFSFVHF